MIRLLPPKTGDPRVAKEILIADSDKADQEEFQRIFGATDYRLIFSESGEDALLRAKLLKPDMIIASGTGLHEMGGLELCGALKGDPEFKHIPFILVSSIFDEISDKDRKRFQADGVISKPLSENEVLNLVDHLVEEEGVRKKGKMVSEKPGDFLLDEAGEGEDEIIELVDVVGEPEPRMSIENFVPPEKEKSFGEMTSLESWERLEFNEKPLEKEPPPRPEKGREEINFQFRRMPPAEARPESELFEKIELEEILEKVEQLKPSLEQEWPSEKEVRYAEEKPSKREEPSEKYLDLPKFGEPPRKEARTELPEEEPVLVAEPKERVSEEIFSVEGPELHLEEEEVQPLPIEEPKKKIPGKAVPIEELAEEEELRELPEEEFLEEFLEEMLGEEEIGGIEKPKEVRPREVEVEEVQLEELEAPRIFKEQIKPLVSEMSKQIQEGSPLVKVVDKHLEEVIAKGIQDMVGDFITKVLPMMTQHIIGLTAERIEKMVKEIVPDLAERAIQEEIKRLQKGEKG